MEEPEQEAADDPDVDSGHFFRVLAIALYLLDTKYSIDLFSFTKIQRMFFTSWSPSYPISIVRCSVSFPFSHEMTCLIINSFIYSFE